MRKMRKVFALLIAAVLCISIKGGVAFAGEPGGNDGDGGSSGSSTITINRDDTWNSSAESANATYTWYKIFDAEITDKADVDPDTGALTESGNVVYTISGDNAAAKVAVLPSIFTAKLAADNKYYITLTDPATTAEAIVTALKTMVDNNTTLFPGTSVTDDADPVVLEVGSDGYYLIVASNGQNLAVQTIGNVEINEKNDYPTVDKKQKKAADSNYTDNKVEAEIGQYIDYQITVHISDDANKAIVVSDTMSAGLAYDDTTGLTLTPSVTHSALTETDDGYDSDATWQIKLSEQVVEANRGTDIVITFRAQITEDCLTDTDRKNEVTLTYDNGNYVLKDEVEYTTYFGGIEKIDGDTDKLMPGVTFTVSSGEAAFNVTPVKDGGNVLYYIPGGDSNEVITNAAGKIIIRGLDNTKTYTLKEKETLEGYNLLDETTDLLLVEDVGDAYTTEKYNQVLNHKGVEMPSTGGMGTTLFYIIGAVLILGAGVVLVARRRMSE